MVVQARGSNLSLGLDTGLLGVVLSDGLEIIETLRIFGRHTCLVVVAQQIVEEL